MTPTTLAAFLAQTLPYLDDPAAGIVQTPWFSWCTARRAGVEQDARPAAEAFHRAAQVSADRAPPRAPPGRLISAPPPSPEAA